MHQLLPDSMEGLPNLSNFQLTIGKKKLFDLCLNCHIQPKFDKRKKSALVNIITVYRDIQDQLCLKSTKQCSYHNSKILTPELKLPKNYTLMKKSSSIE